MTFSEAIISNNYFIYNQYECTLDWENFECFKKSMKIPIKL